MPNLKDEIMNRLKTQYARGYATVRRLTLDINRETDLVVSEKEVFEVCVELTLAHEITAAAFGIVDYNRKN